FRAPGRCRPGTKHVEMPSSAAAAAAMIETYQFRSRERDMRSVAAIALAIGLTVTMQWSARAVTVEKAEFKKVADDVYAFIGKLNDANALWLVSAQGVVVVDTGNNPPETRILQQFIRSVTQEPVRYVIIT